MDIEQNVAQPSNAGGDPSEPLDASDAEATAEAATPSPTETPLDRWAPVESRFGGPGRLVKKVLRRLFKGTFSAQADYNERMLERVETEQARMDAILSREEQLRARIESIERTILEQLEPGLHRVEERTRVTDKDWRQVSDGIDERLEDGIIRIEGIERHLVALQEDLASDFRDVRVTAATQGRQIDDVSGQLVAHVQSVPELEARIVAALDALPDPRALLQSDLEQLHAGQSRLHDEQQSARQTLLERAEALESALASAIEAMRAESGSAVATLGSRLDENGNEVAALRSQLEETGSDVGALRARLDETGSTVEALHARLGEREAEGSERQEGVERRLADFASRQDQLEAGHETLDRSHVTIQAGFTDLQRAHDGLADSQRDLGDANADLQAAYERLEQALTALHEEHRARAAEREAAREVEASMAERVGHIETSMTDRVGHLETAMEERVARVERRTLPPEGLVHYDFNDAFRGSREDITDRLRAYLPHFQGLSKVLDVGCGRGEFLDLCVQEGIGAIGVDADPDMVGHARLNGGEVVEADLFDHLRSLPDHDLDGLFSAQLIEHLAPAELAEMLSLAASKLRRGAPIVLETINPTTWSAMRWFHLDPTHVTPIPPGMLQYLLEQAGFTIVETVYGPTPPSEERLALPDPEIKGRSKSEQEIRALLHRNWSRVNEALFGAQDYAIIATR